MGSLGAAKTIPAASVSTSTTVQAPASTPKKIAASSVMVLGESDYIWSHGRRPKGYGQWAFLKNRDSIGNDIIWVTGKFSDAKKQAQKEAANRGWTRIYIGT